MRYWAFLLVGILLFSAPSASKGQEEDLKFRIANCAAMEGELDRLECYDSLAQELGLVAISSIESIDGSGKWKVQIDTNPLDDSKTVTLILAANEGKAKWGQPILLVLRCKSGVTEAYLNWTEYLGSEASVTHRIGSQPAQTKRWSLSSNNQATFYPDNNFDFIGQLESADKFVAQVTPYNESPVTAVFDVRGLSKAMVSLRETCDEDSPRGEASEVEDLWGGQAPSILKEGENTNQAARGKVDGVVGADVDFPFAYYLGIVKARISRHFNPPRLDLRDNAMVSCVMHFTINRNGGISQVTVEHSSGIDSFDREARRAILSAHPLPKLPPKFSPSSLGISFVFNQESGI